MTTAVGDLLQQLDPMRALRADDNSDATLYVDWQHEFGHSDVKSRLARSILRRDSQAPTLLFTGPRGAGKTTELLRLRRLLEDGAFSKKFFVSTLMAAESLELTDIQPEEITFQVILQVVADLDKAGLVVGGSKNRYYQKLERLVVPEAATSTVNIPFSQSTFRYFPSSRRREFRGFLQSKLPSFIDFVNDQILGSARELLNNERDISDILVIVDDLDRIPLQGTNHENLFIDRADALRALDCHLLYTIPLELLYGPIQGSLRKVYMGNPVPLSAMPVLDFSGRADSSGERTLREILRRRVHVSGLSLPEVFEEEELLREVLAVSGGHVRTLLTIVRSMLMRIEQLPIKRPIFELTLHRLATEFAGHLSDRDWAALTRVHATKRLPYKNDGERWDRLLRDGYVLPYHQGKDSICDSHPLLQYAGAPFLGPASDVVLSRPSLIEDSEVIQPGEAINFTLLQQQLQSVLDTLSEREARVVSMRFGLTDGRPRTVDEISRAYGVTRERIRQIESKAMSKLRHQTRADLVGAHVGQEQVITAGSGHSTGGSGDEPQPYLDDRDKRRYLKGRYPETVPVGAPFGLIASVALAKGPGRVMLKPFDVPREGRDIRLEAYPHPGLRLLGHRLLTLHVPADGDSEPVMFELCADEPGVRAVSLTAWIDGSFLGELRVDITAQRGHPTGEHRDVLAEITTEPTEGAVTLVVRFDSRQNAYRFEFRDLDNPDEVTSNLAYEPGRRVEQLIASLENLAKGRSGHDADQARAHLVNSGAALWHELVPKRLRDQFWERQGRIRQLTILADRDAVPWELLYPMDPGYDRGFLVEQFPVTRAVFGRRPTRKLSLWPARFVLPEGSLPEARAEIEAMRVSLDTGQPPDKVISGFTPLQNLIARGEFGLLHFACHNTYDPMDGSSIKLGNVRFTPTDITSAAINKTLDQSAPTVFINACRSAGFNATYNRLDGWAIKFLEAGAAAFIGSLWAVSDGAAREFAQEFYGQLRAGSPLGQAVKYARAAAASQPDDPTWLAYTVYGDPSATLGQDQS